MVKEFGQKAASQGRIFRG